MPRRRPRTWGSRPRRRPDPPPGRHRLRRTGAPAPRRSGSALDRLGVRVDQELGRVEAVAAVRVVRRRGPGSRSADRARHAGGSRASGTQSARSARRVSHDRPRRRGRARHARRSPRTGRSSCPRRPRRPEREGPARPGAPRCHPGHRASGTNHATPSGGSVSAAENCWPCHGTASAANAPLSVPEPP